MSIIKILWSCNEAAIICDKTQYKNATLKEKLLHHMHLLFCKACKTYTKNNIKLSNMIAKSKVKCLDKNCKEKMKQKFNDALKENSL